MTINKDFCCGYSPERINPGDRKTIKLSIIENTVINKNKEYLFC